MSLALASPTRSLDIGAVLQDGLGALARNFLPFLVLATVLDGPPSMLFALSRIFRPNTIGYFGALLIGLAIAMVTDPILMGALIHGTMRELEGRRASMFECLAVGRRRWLGLLGLSIVEILGVAFGFLLLILPGVLLMLRWMVATSALVMEGQGVRNALGRSAILTRNRRWPIFLLLLIYFALIIVLRLLATTLADGLSLNSGNPWVWPWFASMISIVETLVQIPVATALFRHLRGDPEGGPPDQLAEVFA
jgi:hypothetical protein